MESFQGAVETFVGEASYLGDQDLPAIVTLRRIAAQLDEGEMSPALISQFGLTFRDLRKREPKGEPPADELEQALNNAG